jgi:hypothetical protein
LHQALGRFGYRAFGSYVEREEGGALVYGPFKPRFIAFIETQEQQLGDCNGRIVRGENFLFGLSIGILADQSPNLLVRYVAELGRVMRERRQTVKQEEGCRRMFQGG